jgi:hypothetical protein
VPEREILVQELMNFRVKDHRACERDNSKHGEKIKTMTLSLPWLWPAGWGRSASRGGSLPGGSSTPAVRRGCRRRRGITLTARWEDAGNGDSYRGSAGRPGRPCGHAIQRWLDRAIPSVQEALAPILEEALFLGEARTSLDSETAREELRRVLEETTFHATFLMEQPELPDHPRDSATGRWLTEGEAELVRRMENLQGGQSLVLPQGTTSITFAPTQTLRPSHGSCGSWTSQKASGHSCGPRRTSRATWTD